MKTYPEFYSALEKPFFAPPEWVFGFAWGIIYPLIIIAGIYLAVRIWNKEIPKSLLFLFIANIIGNLLFTPVQLGIDALWPGTLVILFVLGTLAVFEIKIYTHSKIIFWLLVPYLLWGTFATILQITITTIN